MSNALATQNGETFVSDALEPSKKGIPLWVQIVIGSILGGFFGFFQPEWGVKSKLLGDILIRLIQMTIIPLVFPLIVLGIARMHSGKSVGRLALKTVIYFEVITTFLLAMPMLLVNVFNVGVGAELGSGDPSVLQNFLSRSIDFSHFVMDIVPKSVVGAAAEGKILPVLFFGIFFGLALAHIDEKKAKPITDVLTSLSENMFKVISYVLKFSPVGVFGFVAYSIASFGWKKVAVLGELILLTYVCLIIAICVVFPIVARIFKVPYLKLLSVLKDLLIIAFTTRTSEAVLAPCMERLEHKMGVSNSAVSFIMPLGFSFNLDGGSVYWASALLFVANAFGLPMGWEQQIQLLLTLVLLSKGVSGVAGGNMVVLTSVATMFGLPMEGLALIFAVDWICDMGRTLVNALGNCLATCALGKSEHLVDEALFYSKDY